MTNNPNITHINIAYKLITRDKFEKWGSITIAAWAFPVPLSFTFYKARYRWIFHFAKNGKWFSRGFASILPKHLRPPLPKVGDTRYFRMIIGSWGNFAQTRHVMSILLIAFARRYRVPCLRNCLPLADILLRYDLYGDKISYAFIDEIDTCSFSSWIPYICRRGDIRFS